MPCVILNQIFFKITTLSRCNSHVIKLILVQYILQWVQYIQCCVVITTINFTMFHRTKSKLQTSHSPSPSSNPLVTTNLLSISVDLPVLDIPHKQRHTMCGLLCLTSFTEHVFKVYLCCTMYQYLIPFYCRIIFHCIHTPHLVNPLIS